MRPVRHLRGKAATTTMASRLSLELSRKHVSWQTKLQSRARIMFHISATLDRETSARAGAGGTFQVANLKNDEGKDLTPLIDQGRHFRSLEELKQAILEAIADRLTITED
jgi:hypothetical protein